MQFNRYFIFIEIFLYTISYYQFRLVLNAWLKSRSPREVAVFQEMFEKSFQALYTWETQNLQLKMDVLQCNIVQQMLFILEGLVPKPKTEEQEVAASVHESVEGEKNRCFSFANKNFQ